MSLERQWLQVSFRKIGTIAVASAPLCAQKCASLCPLCRALGEAYDLFIVTDASGGVSVKTHAMAVRCMAAGTVPATWLVAVAAEWQRDWARDESIAELARRATRTCRRHRHRVRLGAAVASGWPTRERLTNDTARLATPPQHLRRVSRNRTLRRTQPTCPATGS